jgi:cytochrome P450
LLGFTNTAPSPLSPTARLTAHLGYGYGIRACIGQHLARAEMIALFTELLSRIKHVELAGVPHWTETSFLGGLKRLPIRYRAIS